MTALSKDIIKIKWEVLSLLVWFNPMVLLVVV